MIYDNVTHLPFLSFHVNKGRLRLCFHAVKIAHFFTFEKVNRQIVCNRPVATGLKIKIS